MISSLPFKIWMRRPGHYTASFTTYGYFILSLNEGIRMAVGGPHVCLGTGVSLGRVRSACLEHLLIKTPNIIGTLPVALHLVLIRFLLWACTQPSAKWRNNNDRSNFLDCNWQLGEVIRTSCSSFIVWPYRLCNYVSSDSWPYFDPIERNIMCKFQFSIIGN